MRGRSPPLISGSLTHDLPRSLLSPHPAPARVLGHARALTGQASSAEYLTRQIPPGPGPSARGGDSPMSQLERSAAEVSALVRDHLPLAHWAVVKFAPRGVRLR